MCEKAPSRRMYTPAYGGCQVWWNGDVITLSSRKNWSFISLARATPGLWFGLVNVVSRRRQKLSFSTELMNLLQ